MKRSINEQIDAGAHHFVGKFAGDIFPSEARFSKKMLESAEEKVSFDERPEGEQKDLLLEVSSLVAERRDLVRSTLKKRLSKEEEQAEAAKNGLPPIAFETVRVGTRFVRRMKKAEGEVQKKIEDAELARRSEEARKARLEEVKVELGRLGRISGLREAYESKVTKMWFLMEAAKAWQALRERRAELQGTVDQLTLEAEASGTGALTGGDLLHVRTLQEEMKKLGAKIAEFEAYEDGHELRRLMQLQDYAGMLAAGRIVEVPSVERVVNEGLENLRAHRPFLLAGHLGSGKTEIAKHIARLYMMETHSDAEYNASEPEIFSGSDESSVYDLVGKLKIAARDSGNAALITERVGQLSQAMEKAGVKGMGRDELAKILLGKGDITETLFNYGPLGRAIKRGVPLIIDEINMVPPEVLSRINDILLRRVGDQVRLQENGEESFEIKPGFVVLATCNLGAQYVGIKEVNAAFKSRWTSEEVGYPTIEESYDLVLSALLRKDRVRLPPAFPADQFERLADLAVATTEIQEIFTGRSKASRFMTGKTGLPERAQLKQAVVSTRDLLRKIVEPWKSGGFSKSLDEIIAKNIVASEVFSEKDQKLLAEIFLRRGFFQGWDEKRFVQEGIRSIGKAELDALQAAQMTDAYKNENKALDDLLAQAHGRSALVRNSLLIGTDKRSERKSRKAA